MAFSRAAIEASDLSQQETDVIRALAVAPLPILHGAVRDQVAEGKVCAGEAGIGPDFPDTGVGHIPEGTEGADPLIGDLSIRGIFLFGGKRPIGDILIPIIRL